MPFPKNVKLVEVSPRDGLQNEKQTIATKIKVELIERLADTGLTAIEATSFVSPKWVPQLADGREVFQQIKKKPGVEYIALVPNLKGLEAALSVGVKEIAVFTTASEQFSQKNTNCSVTESIERLHEVIQLAQQTKIKIRAYISCVLGCPYEGEIPIEKTAQLADTLFKMGCDEISLGDTIGVGTPLKTKKLLQEVCRYIPVPQLAVHFHDTYGQALVNIYVALEHGISIIDSSVAGIGGCPYARGATGNVATEDVVYMLQGMGIDTGVDLKKLLVVGRFIAEQVNKKPQSKVNIALGT